ncbi:MAG: valine--tRNA ligase, partial [Sphingomonadaceae bacterium]
MLDKTFEPGGIEARWYAHWEASGAFRPPRPDAPPFTIVLPPPNVTGTLHIGHALNQTLQDVLIRWKRMQGFDARWIVGTDHAGIATQMVVERTIASQGLTRQAMGREAFLATVWDWKAQSGGAITRQMRRLGASCDWANERFTMDDAFSKAVTDVFVRLHEQGLLYRDKRLVNWDPKFQTAISDLEVENREVQGHFWHFRYPLADGTGHLVVATTRPETMLGDTAVAVHPEDSRYAHLVGRMVAHPLTGRQIPVIADSWADPELGTGVVKITPAHDFNDWAVFERNRAIGWINILNPDGTLNDEVPEAFRGLDRFAAREQVVAALESRGLLERVEEKLVQIPHGDRSGAVIEPYLTDQWYVDAAKLAVAARRAVEEGQTRFVPASWEKTYFNWLDGIQPWCVSRQLWWGHRIPAWYRPDGTVIVARSEAEARQKAGPDVPLQQDPDVLDTWFSSALWPFVTLGWPEPTPDLARHYPGDVLVTAFDIIFFWVARMMMQGLHFTGEVPFRTVYCHGLVRDAAGRKMSKSLGNAVDPLTLVDRYGADAVRFTLAALESQGRDVKLDEKRVEGYRNFATKLWNAARFAQGQGAICGGPAPSPSHPVNRWILGEAAGMIATTTAALEALRFDQAADALYHFTWSRFCDWYLELAKPLLAEGSADAAETRATAGFVLDAILRCLHPFMPFVTEELWHALGTRETDLILAPWPEPAADPSDSADEVAWLIDLISAIRSARTELNVPPAARLPLHLPEGLLARAERHRAALDRLARVSALETEALSGGIAQIVVAGETFSLPLGDVIDLAAERARLARAAEAAEREAQALAGRLANPGFLARAKPEAVDKARSDHAARTAEATRLRAALA